MRIALTALALTGTLALAACASEGTSTDPTTAPTTASSSSGTTSESPAPAKVIEITVKDGKPTPNGSTIKVPVGKPIELRVTADAPGELHIHTTPAHALEYKKGVSSITITIPRPGVVEAELEQTGTLVANLEAE